MNLIPQPFKHFDHRQHHTWLMIVFRKIKVPCWLSVTLGLMMWQRSFSIYEAFGKLHKIHSFQPSHLHGKAKMHLPRIIIMKLIWLLFRSVFVWYKKWTICLLNAATNPSLIVQEPEPHNAFTFLLWL